MERCKFGMPPHRGSFATCVATRGGLVHLLGTSICWAVDVQMQKFINTMFESVSTSWAEWRHIRTWCAAWTTTRKECWHPGGMTTWFVFGRHPWQKAQCTHLLNIKQLWRHWNGALGNAMCLQLVEALLIDRFACGMSPVADCWCQPMLRAKSLESYGESKNESFSLPMAILETNSPCGSTHLLWKLVILKGLRVVCWGWLKALMAPWFVPLRLMRHCDFGESFRQQILTRLWLQAPRQTQTRSSRPFGKLSVHQQECWMRNSFL